MNFPTSAPRSAAAADRGAFSRGPPSRAVPSARAQRRPLLDASTAPAAALSAPRRSRTRTFKPARLSGAAGRSEARRFATRRPRSEAAKALVAVLRGHRALRSAGTTVTGVSSATTSGSDRSAPRPLATASISHLLCCPRSSQPRTRARRCGAARPRGFPSGAELSQKPQADISRPLPGTAAGSAPPAEPRRPPSNFRPKGARKPPPGPHRF